MIATASRAVAIASVYKLLMLAKHFSHSGTSAAAASLPWQIQHLLTFGFIVSASSDIDISTLSPSEIPSFSLYSFGITILPSLSILAIPSSPKKQKVRQPKLTHRKTQAPIVAKQIELVKLLHIYTTRGAYAFTKHKRLYICLKRV